MGTGYGLHAQLLMIGHFGRLRPTARLLPGCFQTIDAARAFALGERDLEPGQIRLESDIIG